MKKTVFRFILSVIVLTMFLPCVTVYGEGDYASYLATGEYTGLKEYWYDSLSVGCALSSHQIKDSKFSELVSKNFNSITCENEMKPEALLDRVATGNADDAYRAKLHFDGANQVLEFAAQHDIKVRAHVLVWHSQTPRWFFAEGFSWKTDAPLTDRETMLQRMENYIHDVMDHFNTQYPGVIYAWDVVNEAIEPAGGDRDGLRTESLWYKVIGPDYIEQAFTFARKYAAPGQKLFYNDYNTCQLIKRDHILKLLTKLKEKQLVDGMGMQSHMGMDSPGLMEFVTSVRMYSELGLTIHLTELDFTNEDNSTKGQMKLASRYRTIFNQVKLMKEKNGYDIENITVWGVHDGSTWLTDSKRKCYPLLFTRSLTPKPALFGAMLDTDIPLSMSDIHIREAMEKLGIE